MCFDAHRWWVGGEPAGGGGGDPGRKLVRGERTRWQWMRDSGEAKEDWRGGQEQGKARPCHQFGVGGTQPRCLIYRVGWGDELARHREWAGITLRRGKEVYRTSFSLPQLQPPCRFTGASCTPTLLAIKGAAHGDLEKDGVSPEESRPWTWDGREGPTKGAFSEHRPEACAPKFTGECPAEKSTLASHSAWPCLNRKTNRTGSGLCDITGTLELSAQDVEDSRGQRASPGQTQLSDRASPWRSQIFKTILSHILTLQMGKLRPRGRSELL